LQIDCDRIFGKQDNAGSLLVSDVRLVLLPVRSLTSHYKWVTSPHLIERLQRDLKRAECNGKAFQSPDVDIGRYLGEGEESLFLEERQFGRRGKLPDGVADLIGSLILHDETKNRLAEQLVILHDDDFAWFARFGLAVNARNVLHNEKKTSQNLWYEETIPPDSLLYSLLADRNGGGSLNEIRRLLDDRPYIQLGGNETVGQGWFAVKQAQQLEGGAA
jgi:CRISPR-associated protein Cmr4